MSLNTLFLGWVLDQSRSKRQSFNCLIPLISVRRECPSTVPCKCSDGEGVGMVCMTAAGCCSVVVLPWWREQTPGEAAFVLSSPVQLGGGGGWRWWRLCAAPTNTAYNGRQSVVRHSASTIRVLSGHYSQQPPLHSIASAVSTVVLGTPHPRHCGFI